MTTKKGSESTATKSSPKETSKTSSKPWGEPPVVTMTHGARQSTNPAIGTPSHSDSKTPSGSQKTRITVKYDVGFNNSLFLRGEGPGLAWNKGIKLKNTKADEWVWETNQTFQGGEFKILINDTLFEQGENHKLMPGANVVYTPSF